MSHAYARNYVHVVFSTRQRQRAISPDVQPNLWAYVRGVAKSYAIDLLAIGGTEDHVHLLLALPPRLSLANAIRTLKANSSKWMNESGHFFSWQDGYGAFSVSTSNIEAVRDYIEGQAEHHKTRSFAEEFVAFLKRNGVEFNPEHVLG
jgi:REP element-mobilizing transposase RayT